MCCLPYYILLSASLNISYDIKRKVSEAVAEVRSDAQLDHVLFPSVQTSRWLATCGIFRIPARLMNAAYAIAPAANKCHLVINKTKLRTNAPVRELKTNLINIYTFLSISFVSLGTCAALKLAIAHIVATHAMKTRVSQTGTWARKTWLKNNCCQSVLVKKYYHCICSIYIRSESDLRSCEVT